MSSTAIPMTGSVVDIEFSPDSSTVYTTNCTVESGACGFSLTAIAAPRPDARSARRVIPLNTVAV